MKAALLAVAVIAVSLGACRREVPHYDDGYVPMKLGGPVERDTARN
jgi:hypothetical protein